MTDPGINALARAVSDGTPWRIGTHYGIHVYEGDRPVATFHTVADARRAVDAVNLWITLAEQLHREKTVNELVDIFEQTTRPADNHEDNS